MAIAKKIIKKKSRPSKVQSDDPYDVSIPGPGQVNKPSDDFFEYYTLLYGTSGIGKSSLFSTHPNTFTCMFEPKRRNLSIRMAEFRPRLVAELEQGATNPWVLFQKTIERAEQDDTVSLIVVDNVVECYKCCEAHVLLQEGIEMMPEKDYGRTRGMVNREFESFFNNLKYDSRMGFVFTAHSKEREGEIDSGTTDDIYGPACTGALFDWMKKAMDNAFFYGYHHGKRTVHIRWPGIWTKCGVAGRFLDPQGEPLKAFDIPDVEEEPDSYQMIIKAFNNELQDSDWIPDEDKPKKKLKKKVS